MATLKDLVNSYNQAKALYNSDPANKITENRQHCPICHNIVASSAHTCPQCGCDLDRARMELRPKSTMQRFYEIFFIRPATLMLGLFGVLMVIWIVYLAITTGIRNMMG